MELDQVTHIVEAWRRERLDLDSSRFDVIGPVRRASIYLGQEERETAVALFRKLLPDRRGTLARA